MQNLLTVLTTSSDTANGLSMWSSFGMIAVVFLVMYLLLIRPQRKKEKKDQQMRNNLQVGDEVVTAGGIVGIVFSIKDDTVVIETGGDRSKIRVKRYAISTIETIHETSSN